MQQKFNVTGMTCSACSANVERSVRKLTGVQTVNVNLLSNSMNVEYDETVVDKNSIIDAVGSAGYGASDYEGTSSGKVASADKVSPVEQDQKEMKQRLIISFLFLIPLLYITMGHMLGLPIPMGFMGEENAITYAMTQLLLTVPILYVNRKYYQMGFKTLTHLAPNMDSLIAIGSAAAVS